MRLVHVVPSVDVNTVPAAPTATKVVPVQIIEFKVLVVPLVRLVQFIVSLEVAIVPLLPTTTNTDPVHTKSFTLFKGVSLGIHVVPPSLDVNI